MRILIVKTSSMGDVVHALPVLHDIATALEPKCGEVVFDWLVEEAFVDIVRLSPRVRQVIPIAQRRWRKTLGSMATWREIKALRQQLRLRDDSAVIDLQGLIKSAIWTRWVRAERCIGYDAASARESLAALFYRERYKAQPGVHAIEKMRHLCAAALGYSVEGGPRFDLQARLPKPDWLPFGRYAVLLHATARPEKRYPYDRWIALGQALSKKGLVSVIPWGNEYELELAQSLSEQIALALVAPKMSLAEAAWLLQEASVTVGVDTGLTHLSAALDRPTVALFSATPAWRYGPYWSRKAASLGDDGQWPKPVEVFECALELMGRDAPVLTETAPT